MLRSLYTQAVPGRLRKIMTAHEPRSGLPTHHAAATLPRLPALAHVTHPSTLFLINHAHRAPGSSDRAGCSDGGQRIGFAPPDHHGTAQVQTRRSQGSWDMD